MAARSSVGVSFFSLLMNIVFFFFSHFYSLRSESSNSVVPEICDLDVSSINDLVTGNLLDKESKERNFYKRDF